MSLYGRPRGGVWSSLLFAAAYTPDAHQGHHYISTSPTRPLP